MRLLSCIPTRDQQICYTQRRRPPMKTDRRLYMVILDVNIDSFPRYWMLTFLIFKAVVSFSEADARFNVNDIYSVQFTRLHWVIDSHELNMQYWMSITFIKKDEFSKGLVKWNVKLIWNGRLASIQFKLAVHESHDSIILLSGIYKISNFFPTRCIWCVVYVVLSKFTDFVLESQEMRGLKYFRYKRFW